MLAALHHRHRPLAKLRIILRHDENLRNPRMSANHPLHFFRLNTFSAAKKEVVHSSEDSQPAVLQPAPIASGEPAVGISEGDHLPIAPVACGDAVRPQPHFTIDNPHFAPRQRLPDIRQAVRLLGAYRGGKLGEAVAAPAADTALTGLLG